MTAKSRKKTGTNQKKALKKKRVRDDKVTVDLTGDNNNDDRKVVIDLDDIPSDPDGYTNDEKYHSVDLDTRWEHIRRNDQDDNKMIVYNSDARVYCFRQFLYRWCGVTVNERDTKCVRLEDHTLWTEHGSYKEVRYAYSKMFELASAQTKNRALAKGITAPAKFRTPTDLRDHIHSHTNYDSQVADELEEYWERVDENENLPNTLENVVMACIDTCTNQNWLSSCVFGGVLNHWFTNQEFVKWDFLYPAQNQFYFRQNAAQRFQKTFKNIRPNDYHLLDYLFMFVNDPNEDGVHTDHWQLVVVNYPLKKVQVYNSKRVWPTLPTDALIEALTKYDADDLSNAQKSGTATWHLHGQQPLDWQTEFMDCIKQNDNYSCGVFCLVYCYYLIHGLSVPVDGQREFEKIRFKPACARYFLIKELFRRELDVRAQST